jgi:site-specific DNA-methyltransferase (adenine-specific)
MALPRAGEINRTNKLKTVINLIKGECLEEMKLIPSESIDAIITDPPYGTTACKWDSVIDFELMWEQLNRIIKPNGAIVLFGSEPFSSALRMSNIKNYKYDWVWKKERLTNPLMVKKQAPRYTENISIFYKKQCLYNPQMTKRKEGNKRNNKPRVYKDKTKVDTVKYAERTLSGNNDLIYQPNILEFSMQRGLHPTQKPVKLMEYLIKTYTNENETVLDFTMGSGSTGVACVNTKRNFIGIEQDESYFNIAKERINNIPKTLF